MSELKERPLGCCTSRQNSGSGGFSLVAPVEVRIAGEEKAYRRKHKQG